MRIQIVTVGTTGSVAPYTGLAHRLWGEGHDIEIATHARFADMVACCGMRTRMMETDPFGDLISAHARCTGTTAARGRLPGGSLEGCARSGGPASELPTPWSTGP